MADFFRERNNSVLAGRWGHTMPRGTASAFELAGGLGILGIRRDSSLVNGMRVLGAGQFFPDQGEGVIRTDLAGKVRPEAWTEVRPEAP